jgi:NAD(P)-dependent dehydrogenase (short-subunit alcohol dehydrogenase family)
MKYSEYQPRPDLLKDRIILITGAGDGIGRAAALSYALHGATVVLHGRSLNKLEVIYDEIEGLGAPQPAILPLQLSSASSHDYELLVDTLEQQFGRLDGILHNAGMLGDRVELADYPVDVWDDVMAVNLRAPFALTQALLPLLEKSEHASVVFTSSSVGREARALWGAYSVSKVATEAMSKILAAENTYPNISLRFILVDYMVKDIYKDVYRFRNSVWITSAFILLIVIMGLIGYVNGETQRRSSVNFQTFKKMM